MAEDDASDTSASAAAAAVVSQAIAGFGAQLAAQAFTPPSINLHTIEDIYTEGIRASRSKAAPARVREAWEDAATKLPAQVAADVRRVLEALGFHGCQEEWFKVCAWASRWLGACPAS